MLFNSLHFALFFPIVVILYFAINPKYRWILLLISSYYFYMSWNPVYILLILASTVIDYFVGLYVYNAKTRLLKKSLLLVSLTSNLGLLFIFKYFDFFNDLLEFILLPLGYQYSYSALNVLLPVGISFYTFQTLSYTIDIYRGKQRPQRHFGKFALFVSFFPQLVAGPIERSTHLLPQFDKSFDFEYQRVTDGLKMIFWGLFKKIVIADRIAVIVNQVYNTPNDHEAFTLLLATVLFAFQIFCDFSGYSDIAIGTAKVLGYDLMKNFDKPYYAKSISEFWKRWHISLSTWFRDYVYIPLGGNRTIKWRWYYNLFITFLISGLWHGANLTFVVWGGLHGIYLICGNMISRVKPPSLKWTFVQKISSWRIIRILVIFFLVDFAWIFFRANNLQEAFLIIDKISQIEFNISSWVYQLHNLGVDRRGFILGICSIIIMEVVHFLDRKEPFLSRLNKLPLLARWGLYYFFILYFLFFGNFSSQDFIYFQF